MEEGIRPDVDRHECRHGQPCLRACPVVACDYGDAAGRVQRNAREREWGRITSLWEGHAADPEIRYRGASGGVLTALSVYCLEQVGMHGVLHIEADPAFPLRNRTRLSRTRTELLAAAGSRYAPASVCDRLDLVEAAPSPCVVIGRPVEIAALRNAAAIRPRLKDNIGLAMSFFCAEAPSTKGSLALLERMNVDPKSLKALRYRGHGWPGYFTPVTSGQTDEAVKLTYGESWGFLQSFRPWAAQLWPDGAGELADITCGDPWYETPDGKNPGFSLVVARTERGDQCIREATAAGYVKLRPAEHWKLERSQHGLLEKKGSVWGRRLVMRIFGLPVTRFSGIELFHCWLRLRFRLKFRSVFGTARRIIGRRLYLPVKNG